MHIDDRLAQGRGTRTRMCSSRSCASLTSVGASVSGSAAVWVFGKAITSRMLSAPAMSKASADSIREVIAFPQTQTARSEEHTSELQSRGQLVCPLPLEKQHAQAAHPPP